MTREPSARVRKIYLCLVPFTVGDKQGGAICGEKFAKMMPSLSIQRGHGCGFAVRPDGKATYG